MSDLKTFKLPDVGEGLTEADIIKWHVQPGDKVSVNQTIVEIETAKAMVELPCPFQGVVTELLVAEGQTVDVGTPIIAVDTSGGAGRAPEAGRMPQPAPAASDEAGTRPGLAEDMVPSPPSEGAVEPGVHGGPAPKQERQPVLVGYGVKLGKSKRRPRKAPAPAASASSMAGASAAPVQPAPAPAEPSPQQPAAQKRAAPTPVAAPPVAAPTPAAAPPVAAPAPAAAPPAAQQPAAQVTVLAKPPVRKLARELGVDLGTIDGSGPGGSITRSDVQAAADAFAAGAAAGGEAPAEGILAMPARGRPAAEAGPLEERIAVRGVRKHTAAAVVASAFTAPHVTEFLQIDVTATMEAVQRIRGVREFADLRVSPLLLVVKALLLAVARHPMINSSWDDAAQEIVVKRYVNLGIAAATDRGLIVPNIKNAHSLALPELAHALANLAQTARAGKTSPADLQGGTITITNVGIFGVDTGTPILTPGEAAILAFGQIRDMPWVHDGELAVRKICTLSLSFDHRIVDGDLGSAVLRDVGAMLQDPVRMIAWG